MIGGRGDRSSRALPRVRFPSVLPTSARRSSVRGPLPQTLDASGSGSMATGALADASVIGPPVSASSFPPQGHRRPQPHIPHRPVPTAIQRLKGLFRPIVRPKLAAVACEAPSETSPRVLGRIACVISCVALGVFCKTHDARNESTVLRRRERLQPADQLAHRLKNGPLGPCARHHITAATSPWRQVGAILKNIHGRIHGDGGNQPRQGIRIEGDHPRASNSVSAQVDIYAGEPKMAPVRSQVGVLPPLSGVLGNFGYAKVDHLDKRRAVWASGQKTGSRA